MSITKKHTYSKPTHDVLVSRDGKLVRVGKAYEGKKSTSIYLKEAVSGKLIMLSTNLDKKTNEPKPTQDKPNMDIPKMSFGNPFERNPQARVKPWIRPQR